jgi:RNA polymerase sigma-70 factor, ECF subfamily
VALTHSETVSLPEHLESTAHFERDLIPALEPLRRRAVRITSAPSDAEDLLQETLLRAYAARHSFRSGTDIKAWLFRIMINTYISSYRAMKRRPQQCTFDQITDRHLAASAARRPAGLWSAEDQVLATLPDSRIRAAMHALPEQFRTAVYLADVSGFSYKEIAAIMDIGEGTVCSRIHRGRKQLRKLLTEARPERGIADQMADELTGGSGA